VAGIHRDRICRYDRISLRDRHYNELGLRNRRVHFQLDLAFQRRRDARAETARRVRVNLHGLLDHVEDRFRIVLHEVSSCGIKHPHGLGACHVEAAVRKRPVITGRYDQVSSAFAAVRAREADIDDPWNHMSLMVPTAIGGCSITIGPLVRSTTLR
jgi:hypothetical protein